jgi:hypothetical protein
VQLNGRVATLKQQLWNQESELGYVRTEYQQAHAKQFYDQTVAQK